MENITEAFDEAKTVYVIKDGNEKSYSDGSAEYGLIVSAFNRMVEGARQMPAYGVSLDKETRKAKKRGLWVEFDFGKAYECSGMPFEKLLVEVADYFQGFNLIRYTSEYGYDGRCFYLDLDGKNMFEFYRALSDL